MRVVAEATVDYVPASLAAFVQHLCKWIELAALGEFLILNAVQKLLVPLLAAIASSGV